MFQESTKGDNQLQIERVKLIIDRVLGSSPVKPHPWINLNRMGLVWNPSRWKCPNNTQWKCPNQHSLLAEGAARAEEANRLDLFDSPSSPFEKKWIGARLPMK